MRIHVLSDLHLEVAGFQPHQVECDVVVLAGDIANHTDGLDWARRKWPDKEIIYVPGNHEFYNQDRFITLLEMEKMACDLGVHLLDNTEVVIGGVRFLGSTLWTDFNLFGEAARQKAIINGKSYLNDFRLISEQGWIFSPERSIVLHQASVAWLTEKLKKEFEGETVIVTHHLPSMKSISEKYKTSMLSACFASWLNDLMGKSALWIHGHAHNSSDYELNGTRVVCNPRGYCRYNSNQENFDFNPSFVVEI